MAPGSCVLLKRRDPAIRQQIYKTLQILGRVILMWFSTLKKTCTKKTNHVDRVETPEPLQPALDAREPCFRFCEVTLYPKGILVHEEMVWPL